MDISNNTPKSVHGYAAVPRAAVPSQEVVYDRVYDGLHVRGGARGAVQLVRGRGGGVVPGQLALAARAELHGVVVGDVAVPPQVEARALGVLLRRAVLRHQRAQPVLAAVLQQHEPLLDEVLKHIRTIYNGTRNVLRRHV